MLVALALLGFDPGSVGTEPEVGVERALLAPFGLTKGCRECTNLVAGRCDDSDGLEIDDCLIQVTMMGFSNERSSAPGATKS